MSLKRILIQQFKKPSGLLGKLAGYIMANRASNIERNHWTIALLDVAPDDLILEIGFGPGIAIEELAQIISTGKIFGIDHSNTMLKQASKRNRDAIDDKRVLLSLLSVDEIGKLNQKFDKILSANAVQFWPDPLVSFHHLYDALKFGGTIATTFMPRMKGATKQDAIDMSKRIENNLSHSGFRNIKTELREFSDMVAICVLAEK